MPGTDLFPDEPEFTPRPAWQVIEAARRHYLTGELTLHTSPTTRIYLRDGMVYFAERSTDGTLAIRLMMEGVITRAQMQRGTVIVNGVEHVGRLFDADPTIDRPSVELCCELFTDDVMVDVANTTVTGYELALYRRHSSGIDRWYPHAIPVSARPNETATEPEHAREPEVAAEVIPDVKPADESEEQTLFQPSAESFEEPAAEMLGEPVGEPPPGPTNKLDAPPITAAVPVTQPVPLAQSVGITSPPSAMTTQPLPITPWDTGQLPAVTSSAPVAAPLAAPPVASSNELDATTIADEVAEAIKRAFAGMGA